MGFGFVCVGRLCVALQLCCATAALLADDTAVIVEEPLPSSEELYRQYLEHNGGRSNLLELNTLVATGRIETMEGQSLPFRMTRKQPNKFRLKVEHGDYTVETLSNGRQVWSVVTPVGGDAQIAELSGQELVKALADGSMDGPFMKVAGRYAAIKAEAFEEVRGVSAIRVAISPKVDVPYHTIWLSAEHYQEVKLAMSEESAEEGVASSEIEIYFADFEKLLGVYHATEISYVIDGVPGQTIHIERSRANVGVFDSYFEK